MRFKPVPTRLMAAFLLAPFAAIGQTPPNAGQILQQVTPAPRSPAAEAPPVTVEERRADSPAGGERFALRALRFSGNTLFTDAELLTLAQGLVGQTVGLAELDELTQRIARHYRQRGYLVATAWLPPQEIRDGVVQVAIAEGRLGRVEIDNRANLSAGAIAPASRLLPGDPVQGKALEETLLRLADLPGVEVKSTLRPGAAVGTSDFLVQLTPGRAFTGSVDADSFGNRFTGEVRAGATLNWNNPTGTGDQASLRAQASGERFNYVRAGYQLPFGPQGTRAGFAWSHMNYELGEQLAPLGATGRARIASLYLQHPLVRGRAASWYANLQYDDKNLEDQVGATAFAADKSLRNWTAGFSGSFIDALGGADGAGATSVALNYTRGRLAMDAASAAVDAASARSAGSFGKWALFAQRNQRLGGEWSLLGTLNAQWANKNLDSAEKMVLGGATAVRAYPQGEASGDSASVLSLELRRTLGASWMVSGFYDEGHVRINRSPWAAVTANERRLAGYGLGVAWLGSGVTVSLYAAWKAGTGAPVSDTDRSPRLWAQAAYTY